MNCPLKSLNLSARIRMSFLSSAASAARPAFSSSATRVRSWRSVCSTVRSLSWSAAICAGSESNAAMFCMLGFGLAGPGAGPGAGGCVVVVAGGAAAAAAGGGAGVVVGRGTGGAEAGGAGGDEEGGTEGVVAFVAAGVTGVAGAFFGELWTLGRLEISGLWSGACPLLLGRFVPA